MLDNFSLKPSVVMRDQPSNSGFALVIALSLMAFVLLLLLSITAFVQVENANSARSRAQLGARSNALLAMQMALGELQMATGLDQRITGRGDIRATTDVSKANYTAVWDATAVVAAGEVASPIKWLVSGADTVETDDDGNPVDFGATASNATDVELVSARNGGLIEAVKVAPVSIANDKNQAGGEIAWWVGDEGVKAKFNLVESTYLRDSTIDSDGRLGVSPRFGIEAMEGFETAYAYSDDAFAASLRKIVSVEQGSILNSELGATLEDHFHDLSFYSHGLLTNTREGGLKQDLTHYFEGNLGGPMGAIRADGSDALSRITWEQLNSFYNLGHELISTPSDDGISTDYTITARAQEETVAGVYPLLTYMHLNYGMTLESNFNGVTPAAPEDRIYSVYAHIRPAFVLSNPYNTKLEVSNYRIYFGASDASKASDDVHLKISYGDAASAVPSTTLLTYTYKDILRNMVFVVPEVTLEPGEALYFSLSPSGESTYGYSFHSSAYDGYYTSLTDAAMTSNAPQQFVFEAADDSGITSIRLGSGVSGISGADIEYDEAGTRRIKAMYLELTQKSGSNWMRTYLGDSASLDEDDKILQDIGPFRYYDLAHGNNYYVYQGYWPIDNLPSSLLSFDYASDPTTLVTRRTEIPLDTSSERSKKLSTTSISNIFILHGAVSAPTRSFHSGYDGWATDYNLRAPRMTRYKYEQESFPAYGFTIFADGVIYYYGLRYPNLNDAPNFSWGAGYAQFSASTAAQVEKVILFDVPRLDGPSGQPALASLGQLQHFNPGGWTESFPDNADINPLMNSLGYTPSYAIGNSYAAPLVPREATVRVDEDTDPETIFSDVSYLLNEALFDEYFFSTIPQDSAANIEYSKLANKRLVAIDTVADEDVRSSGTAAAEHLLVDGAFNVNSTSVGAWYALLNSFRGFEFGNKDASDPGQGIFPRSLYQSPEFVEGQVDGVSNGDDSVTNDIDAWAGWRHMEDDASLPMEERKLYQLAEAIVEEVKARGPFLSMSDFVNRKLVLNTDSDARLGLSGALQAALDRTINCNFDPDYDAITTNSKKGIVDFDHLGSGLILNVDGTPLLREDGSTVNASAASSTPAWVLQGDLLQALAPAMSVRSDTFTIRSYGNLLHPVTGKVSAEAYVEAVVQRIPEYLDTSDAPDKDVDDPTLSVLNQLAGRRFAVIDIRFLDKSEL
ncbi:hypothetical protein QEH52_02155 [Coraliomargarita sp. SDUM461003]|uniref:Type 4 fimbrial biogenesis protein PilX N-terminal domain-containing protein n=1 Tax=Thalassobacterium maritimum TaxID=3041265 RepID=A0ABU1AQ79_9BACT|nr:hypothetical protein [Coraliomargarita sp. SDUM461003]MDQ8206293.1 hypothetical protein [Coraliomargarita sp. SDUM461003]